jgi:hypothetical protein
MGAISGFYFSGYVLAAVQGNVQTAVWLSIVPTGICLVATLLFAYFYRGTLTARLVRPLLNPSRASQAVAFQAGNGSTLELVKQLPCDFWVLFVLIGCCYGVVLPFEIVAVNFFEERYQMDAKTAGTILSVCPAFALLSPIFSSFVYESKKQVLSAFAACMCITTSIVSMALGVEVYKLIILLGAGYMLFTNVVWVLVPQIVSQTGPLQTVAIGVAGVSTSLFVAVGNYLVSLLRGTTGSYDAPLIYLSCVSLVGLGCSVKLLRSQPRWKLGDAHMLSTAYDESVDEGQVTRLSPSSPFIEPEYRGTSAN